MAAQDACPCDGFLEEVTAILKELEQAVVKQPGEADQRIAELLAPAAGTSDVKLSDDILCQKRGIYDTLMSLCVRILKEF
jgi:hypothetical protein